MLLQLLPEKELNDIIDSYESPDPMTVLGLVAKYNKLELKDATIILVVDGMQNLMTSYEDGLNTDSLFYKTLTNIDSHPIEQSLKLSNQKHIYLPVTSLEPPTLNQNEDCGGHRRALEIL
ncbi:hypothetical protein BC937DRAFT_93271 [Endogone sp. FLAS-F59071]|nr:hypothetical protein BC937DRAFT_93271 [Endogone sp. FLAS-F59071]|eukprot:RUS14822.1 hypothetical protein BC937DRAFT_93271 [Endogone sp. FLAS-F59071]